MPKYRFTSNKNGGMIRQPFQAVCAKCHSIIYFDIDESGTKGFNGDWGDGRGDYGCEIDNGEDSEDGNGHIPMNIQYNRDLYPRPKD